MKLRVLVLSTIAATLVLSAVAPAQTLMGTEFTYQGQIKQNGIPFTGTCDFKFELYNASSGSSGVGQIGTTQTKAGIIVSNGLFTVALDFGGVFHSDMRWLDVKAACPSGGSYVALSPRQQITATPYALALPGFHTEMNTTSPNIIGGHSGNIVDAGVYGATISGGGSAGAGYGEGINHVYGKYGTISGGARNNAGGDNNNAGKNYATVGGGYINTARGESSTIGGGWQNAAIGLMATVAGGGYNFAEGAGSFIGGGGVIVGTNSVTTAGNQARGNGSTIPGGANNYISTNGTYAAIGGGESNTANGYAAMVGGGTGNSSGDWASVPGGRDNFANGAYSFAAGRRAKAGAAGSFVWSDSNDSDTWSFNPNEFVARATGGFYFYTGINPTSGARLQAGSGTWSDLSDKNSKTDFTPVDSQEVLTRLSRIPLSTWRYKSQADGIRHMGPMAQDVYAAFGLGEDERYISTIDADGVALAAIQGLHQELKDRDAKIATLESRLTELEQVVKQLAAGQKER